jgi:hypothetical protein
MGLSQYRCPLLMFTTVAAHICERQMGKTKSALGNLVTSAWRLRAAVLSR